MITSVVVLLLVFPCFSHAYPLDGYATTGIGRLEAARRIQAGDLPGEKQPPGALLSMEEVDLRLLHTAANITDFSLPTPDSNFTAQIVALLGGNADRYSIAVLDLSNLSDIRYAEQHGSVPRNPGSVGKILVALAFFQALADLYPDDIAARRRILGETVITADVFHKYDSHTVRLWDPVKEHLTRRPLQDGDRGTLWEYLDWMMSPSSNAAAGMLMKHLILLSHFGLHYPVSPPEADAFFRNTPKSELGAIFEKAMQSPVSRNGLDLRSLRQGSFFTREGKNRVPGTSSYATSRELMRFLLRLEQGGLADPFSSREIKRLLYVTERRIRYASSPVLRESAVYFKSGSLFECAPEPEFTCKKYHGNVMNLMNSIAIVETFSPDLKLHYLVAMMSNVLRKNSAVDHQTLATQIHRLIERTHEPQRAKRTEAGDGQ